MSRNRLSKRTTLNARKEQNTGRVLIVQNDQAERLGRRVRDLGRLADELQREAGAQSPRLDDLEGEMERLWREPGLSRPRAEELERVPIDPDLLPSDREMLEIRQRLPDLSLGLELPDADGDWDAYILDVDAYIERHGIDVDRDPLTQLLPAGRVAEIVRRFDEDYGPTPWDKWDWTTIGLTVAAGFLLDYFRVATPDGKAFKGVPQRGSPVTKWLKDQSEKLAPMKGKDGLQRNAFQQWVAELATKAEVWARVPYDKTKPKIGLTPNTHRVASLGHDPVLGLVFGTMDIVRGKCSFIDANGRWQVRQGGRAGEQDVLRALVKVIVHGFSDVFTAKGLPPPFLPALQTLKVNSGFTLREGGDPVSVTHLIRHMYSNGYDLRHFATMAVAPGFAELAIRIHHYVRVAARGEKLGKDGIRDRLKLSQMLTLTHALLASGNIVKTALYGRNPAALNYTQYLALGTRLISLAKLSSERNRLIRKELADGWEALLDESRRLTRDRDRREDQLDKAAP